MSFPFAGPPGIRGRPGRRGPQGDRGPAGGLLAYGYAVGQSTTTIGANSDVAFDLGAEIFPNTGFTYVPLAGEQTFVVATTGVYEFDFYVSGLPSTNVPLEFALYVNGMNQGVAYEFRSNTGSVSDYLTVIGQGLISLAATDTVTLRNRTNSGSDTVSVTNTPAGGEAGANRTLLLKRIS